MTLLNAREAAERLGIHPSLVRAYLRTGRLKATRQNPWMVEESEVERFKQTLRPIGRPPSAARGTAGTGPLA